MTRTDISFYQGDEFKPEISVKSGVTSHWIQFSFGTTCITVFRPSAREARQVAFELCNSLLTCLEPGDEPT